MTSTIQINLPHHQYAIRIEPGSLTGLGAFAAEVISPGRMMLVMDDNVVEPHGHVAMRSLCEAGFEVAAHTVVASESNKSLATMQELYEAMLTARLDRSCSIVALGGGVVGDIAGFAAATFLRGIPVIQVPTTLLAMVDASVGGKTGVNFPLPADADGNRELGKNLIGAFWQPAAVSIDPHVLTTLNERDFRCGLAETVKHGVIADLSLLEFIEQRVSAIASLELDVLTDLIDRSVRIKAAVVEEDEREAGKRALLNLGHTFAHAIEPIKALDLRHGEAVSIGMCAASSCAIETSRMKKEESDRLTDLLKTLGLPVKLTAAVDVPSLIATMGYDKKVAGGRLRLILPCGLGAAEIVTDLDRRIIQAAWDSVATVSTGRSK